MLNSRVYGCFLLLIELTVAFYDSSDVVQLTSTNFDQLVTQGDAVWILQYYAPWCGYSRRLAPQYKEAATLLKGVVKVGAVDCASFRDICIRFEIRGLPTIKIFSEGGYTDFGGQRTSSAIAEAGRTAVPKTTTVESVKTCVFAFDAN